jgi:hypothetical protein
VRFFAHDVFIDAHATSRTPLAARVRRDSTCPFVVPSFAFGVAADSSVTPTNGSVVFTNTSVRRMEVPNGIR